MIRKALRMIGIPIHSGWRDAHKYGFDIRCTGCGERRSMYGLSLSGPSWWEKTESGDGGCGHIAELPTRVY